MNAKVHIKKLLKIKNDLYLSIFFFSEGSLQSLNKAAANLGGSLLNIGSKVNEFLFKMTAIYGCTLSNLLLILE